MKIDTPNSLLNNVKKVKSLILKYEDTPLPSESTSLWDLFKPKQPAKFDRIWKVVMEYDTDNDKSYTFWCSYSDYAAAKSQLDDIKNQIKNQDEDWVSKQLEDAIKNA